MKYTFEEYVKSPILENHLNMGGKNPDGEEINLTSKYFTRGGKPFIGVMGEFHFSRCHREEWHRELAKMKAGGITIVSTYLFWIYHEETEGVFNFEGDNDIRCFIEECADMGLDAVIRIGPWAHGECRNGGFPDWLLKKPFVIRDNNEDYLSLVRKWFAAIYEEVKGLFYKDGGNIIAVQLENELTDNAEHIAKLKETAIECGIAAPLYTATGWNSAYGARIPVDEVVPVFGGYVDAPWTGHTHRLDPSPHYFFNKMRNDSAIGADLIMEENDDGWQLPYERYPFATCELGGGLQVTHHRRPLIKPMDIYALSLVKLGVGNNLIGYYMYKGGTNQIGRLSTFNETKATGYPNDYPIKSYDFQAPVSEFGEIRGQYRLLNLLHLFVADFGDVLAPLDTVSASYTVDPADKKSLRYCMRTDGKSGFVFINHYQRLDALEPVNDVIIDTGNAVFPSINVDGDICFFMPFNMELSGNILEYSTAQPLCRKDNTYFFVRIPGIDPEFKFAGGEVFKNEDNFVYNSIRIVVADYEKAQYLRRLGDDIYIGGECDLYEEYGEIKSVQDGRYECQKWNGSEFETFTVSGGMTQARVIIEDITEAPFEPKYPEELNIGGKRRISWKKITADGKGGFAEIDYIGDAAQLYADGELAADDFYYGKAWRVPCSLLYGKECYIAISEMKDDFYKEF